MRHATVRCGTALLLAALWIAGTRASLAADLQDAVPSDVYMAVYARHNPERDYQRAYWKEVWKAVEETKIVDRAIKIFTDRAAQDDVDQARAILDEFREALAPVDWKAMGDCREFVYAQTMDAGGGSDNQMITSQHLVLMRLTPEAAAGCHEALENLFRLAEKYAGDKVQVEKTEKGDVTLTELKLPKEAPFRPMIAHVGDVVLFSSSQALAENSLAMLTGGKGESKFADPRVKAALAELPEAEDGIVVYDGRTQFAQLDKMGDFIRRVGKNDPNAERAAKIIELVMDEFSIMDCEVTVEYTEGNQNRSASFGKLIPGAEEKLLAKVVAGGKPFENWGSWVPADAVSYHLTTGINLHPACEWTMNFVREEIPEAREGLEKFEAWQAEHGVHVDRDILQAFSGEMVSVTLPGAGSSLGAQQSVTALRCQKPERIRELLHRLMDFLKEQPALKAQMLDLKPVESLEGFEEVSAALLMVLQARPVIGFRDDWMYFGSSAAAVEKVLAVQSGEGEAMADAEAFKRFGMEIEGPVASIQYTDLSASTRGVAQFLKQAGAIAPMVIGMAGANNADPEAMAVIQEVAGLLPSLGKIVEKLDFYEARLATVQAGEEPGTYVKRSVTLVRPGEEQ